MQVNDKLQAKVEKHYAVTKVLFEHYKVEMKLTVPFVEYSRYVLKSGTENEKTALANGIQTKLQIKNGQLKFQNS